MNYARGQVIAQVKVSGKMANNKNRSIAGTIEGGGVLYDQVITHLLDNFSFLTTEKGQKQDHF